MISAPDPALVLRASEQRLRVACGVLLEETPEAEDVGGLLEALVLDVREHLEHARAWLLLCALGGGFPRPHEVQTAVRNLELLAPRDAVSWLLTWTASTATFDEITSEIEIVTDRPLVDVHVSASSDLSTGIQRVVRNLVPLWCESRTVTLVRWSRRGYVGLDGSGAQRLLGDDAGAGDASRRLIPWGVPVLLPEVPFPGRGERLTALAQFSPNRVGLIGYDCIPAVSADLVPDAEREKFGEYLELVKYADVVAGISETAAAEFAGFVSGLSAQGLPGPEVAACGLPTSVTVVDRDGVSPTGGTPEVLCVGSLDPRKNQIALVEAAEHLWREGLRFTLRLVGSGGAKPADLLGLLDDLIAAGRPIEVGNEVSDAVLDSAYRSARVLVFPTLHEGFGLPIVEALSYGVPVITSDFGSTREIAEGAGAFLVDPEDVWALADALRRVLTDDELHATLVEQARSRPDRTWHDYAEELWQVLVP